MLFKFSTVRDDVLAFSVTGSVSGSNIAYIWSALEKESSNLNGSDSSDRDAEDYLLLNPKHIERSC